MASKTLMRKALAIGAVWLCAPAIAQAPHSYGDTLIDELMARYPGVAAIELDATANGGTQIILTRGRDAALGQAKVSLTNSMGDEIGKMIIRFGARNHATPEAIAYDASRRIYLANNLIEPDPFVPGAHRSRLGQAIVERMMARNPDLVTLGMHIGASGASNAILASNFGRIGKPGDKDDARVIDGGETLNEPTNGGRRLAVSLPMLDRRGRVVGALSTSFLVGPGGVEAASRRAVEVRNAVARRIASLAQLLR